MKKFSEKFPKDEVDILVKMFSEGDGEPIFFTGFLSSGDLYYFDPYEMTAEFGLGAEELEELDNDLLWKPLSDVLEKLNKVNMTKFANSMPPDGVDVLIVWHEEGEGEPISFSGFITDEGDLLFFDVDEMMWETAVEAESMESYLEDLSWIKLSDAVEKLNV